MTYFRIRSYSGVTVQSSVSPLVHHCLFSAFIKLTFRVQMHFCSSFNTLLVRVEIVYSSNIYITHISYDNSLLLYFDCYHWITWLNHLIIIKCLKHKSSIHTLGYLTSHNDNTVITSSLIQYTPLQLSSSVICVSDCIFLLISNII